MRESPRDPYQVLGVAPSATPEEIAFAYRRLVRDLHPDTRGRADQRKLDEVLAAYRMLRDPQRRARHDHQRAEQPTAQRATAIPVRRRRPRPDDQPDRQPDLRAGPVRRHRPGH